MRSLRARPLPRVGLFDRLLDRRRFPVLPRHGDGRPAEGGAPMVCRMIFEELCVLATGEIVCSCGDPAGLAVYGNVHRDLIEPIFRGRRYRRMRRWQLEAAPGSFCPVVRSRCGGRVSRATALDTEAGRAIRVLQLEPTSRCDLRCPGCPVSNFRVDRSYRGDRTATLPLATMLRVVDQLPDLEKLLFYDFGEPFLHPEAIPFLREIRRRRPDVTVHTSTNGLAFAPGAIEALAGEALADRVVFSIDGASEASYRRYRRGGSFGKVRDALDALCAACDRAGTRDRVDVVWQYILFDWNDGDDEIARARRLAAEAGARLSFVVTHTPGASRRYVDGSPETARLLAGGDAYEALTCDARMKHLWSHGGVAGDRYRACLSSAARAVAGPAGREVLLAVGVRNGGRLPWGTSGPAVRLGLRLRTVGGRVLRELPGVAIAPPELPPGASVALDARVPLPDAPGRYELFVDVVEEGVCWFSDRGSAPLALPLEATATRRSERRDEARDDCGEGGAADEEPEDDSLGEGADPDTPEHLARQPGPDQEERHDEALPRDRDEDAPERCEGRQERPHRGGDDEAGDEERKPRLLVGADDERRAQDARHDPERPRQLHRRRHRERLRAVARGRADDARGVVDREAGPEAEGPLVEVEEVPDRREEEERRRIEGEDGRQRNGDLLALRLHDRRHRRDRAPAADRRAERDERREGPRGSGEAAEEGAEGERQGDPHDGVDGGARPDPDDRPEAEAEAETDDGHLEERLREGGRPFRRGVPGEEAEEDPRRQGHRRPDPREEARGGEREEEGRPGAAGEGETRHARRTPGEAAAGGIGGFSPVPGWDER